MTITINFIISKITHWFHIYLNKSVGRT